MRIMYLKLWNLNLFDTPVEISDGSYSLNLKKNTHKPKLEDRLQKPKLDFLHVCPIGIL